MIAIAATVRPLDSIQVLHLLEQRLRRNFRGARAFADSLMIPMPGVGLVLVTEQFAQMRLEFVAADEDSATPAMVALEEQIREQAQHQPMSFRWEHPSSVPVAFQ